MTPAPRSLEPAATLPEVGLDAPSADAHADDDSSADASRLPAPSALLLDFGGVVVTTVARLTWARELAEDVVDRAAALEVPLDPALVEESLRAGRTALSLWKNAASRRLEPRELAPAEIVGDFLLADLPAAVRAALTLEAEDLLATMAVLVAEHHQRPGIAELLTECSTRGIPLGIVSNAHSGRAHRRILADLGLDRCFGVQIYSDEVGIRKPHPGMLRLAVEALGIAPADAWYVGDTLDRDVAAGRRAGVGAVVITRDRRTDHPPFPVAEVPDLVLDTPEGLVAALRGALARAADGAAADVWAADGSAAAEVAEAQGATPRTDVAQAASEAGVSSAPSARRGRPAVLLDHGGVITLSTPNPHRDGEVGALIVELSERMGHPVDLETASAAVAAGWDRHRARKRERDASDDPAHRHDEIDPAVLWGDLVGRDLPEPLRAALSLEARGLSLALHRAKSVPAPRPGALELIAWCRAHGIVVGIVSNTVSGRGVREILARYGVARDLGPSAYSDEIGVRKPGGAIFEAALAGLDTAPADVVYVGDKALNDGVGATAAGIGTVCLLRGGKDADETLEAALVAGEAYHLLDSPEDLIDLLSARLAEARP
ncbi:HAD family hydrolase [Brachybacterium aquaticum]|uniref:HAD superfamily hydrolase (TIGR01549 family) n=1 Tax=Brachybacterium aquaticum TaxID=1432564 RepID=A0A841AD85_9MICO|nr:HAD family hydrolase [Brachybacterium aquaticum]MBB5833249.1 HAD superfamily hydrolase (TIGR01549 family) [Brachybacterium aquaticum]